MKKYNKILALLLVSITLSPFITNVAVSANDNIHNINHEYQEKENHIRVDDENESLNINGKIITKSQLKEALKHSFEIDFDNNDNDLSLRFAPALAGVFVIPGVGEVVIVAGGITLAGYGAIKVGGWLYDTISSYLSNHSTPHQSIEVYLSNKYGIPEKLINKDGKIKMGSFGQKMKGKTAYKDPKTGYYIDKDTSNHGGRKWKLKDKSGERKASLSDDGKILSD